VESRRIFGAIGRMWWILAITVIAGFLAGILATTLATPEYTATTRLFVSAAGGSSSSESESGGLFSVQRTESYAHMITTEQIAQRVIDQLKLPMSARELSSKVTAAIVPRTVLFDVSATDPSPDRAADIANEFANTFTVYAGALETPVGSTSPRVTVTVFSRAKAPSSPISPTPGKNVFYGVAGGIGVGLAAMALATVFSRRIHSADELGRITGAPALGPINTPIPDVDDGLAHLAAWDPRVTEDLRRLRVEIDAHDPAPRVVLATSASPGNSATPFGVGLAVAFCETGCATALLVADAELGSRPFGSGLGDGAPGLAELLKGESSFDEVLRPTPRSNLFLVLTARPRALRARAAAADIEPLLSSTGMRRFVDDLRREFDRVVIVTASINASSAAAVLSAIVDADLLVVNAETARRSHVERAMSELKAARAHLLGAVLVKAGTPGDRWKWIRRPRMVDRSLNEQESSRGYSINNRLPAGNRSESPHRDN
jgi:succinoglycan biosynthesis transport protein ExoP